ncbi:hypothetical protein [Streptomyces sp. NPDC003077]|uniref:hypothetical protein n=1 Tax=Streptomyces sp. NPDC003077 TaxID=3154443 RepID=UPI0033B47A86
MSARRPLLTATAAGSVLLALWFVPSANATVEHRGASPAAERSPASAEPAAARSESGPSGPLLADTGSVDTTPYVVGGVASLGVGAGLVVFSLRRRAGGAV